MTAIGFSFAFGIAVFYATNYLTGAGQWLTCAGLAAAATGVLWLPGLDDPRLGYSQAVSICLSGWFAVALIGLRPWDALMSGAAWLRPLFGCGIMCYSLYLVHQLIVHGVALTVFTCGFRTPTATLLFTVPMCLAVALAAGFVFYQFIERRFLNSTTAVVKA